MFLRLCRKCEVSWKDVTTDCWNCGESVINQKKPDNEDMAELIIRTT